MGMQVSRRLDDGGVVQAGYNLGELDGCEIVTLDAQQQADYQAAPWPNGGITLTADGVVVVAKAPPPPTTRIKTIAEYKAEFAAATTERRQTIRDIVAGLVDREVVPADGLTLDRL